MFKINKVTSHTVIDYAAEELKKYLRMMMPEGGDVEISYDPKASDGFKLGVMTDMGLDASDVLNPELDDVIYIETDTRGGTIAGANPRAVLIAVYEYLRRNGCEWLMPGVDGEFIPMRDIVPVKYRHKPSMRYRGNCIEGATSQKILEGFIDFMPKLGLNCFMIQFRNPVEFYKRHYNHYRNTDYRPEEPITDDTSIQWTRRLECEMDKRGIMLHSCGHGWTNDPFGIDSSLGWRTVDDSVIPDEFRDCIALVNGKRTFFRSPPNTQFCMSNKRARRLFVDYVAKIDGCHFTGVKNGTASDPAFRIYKDGYSVLSGSVHPEIVAQAGCVHMLTNEANKGKLAYFMGIDRTDFYGAVLPGDQMRLEVEIPDTTKRFGKGEGYLYVDDKVISKTNLTFAIVDA